MTRILTIIALLFAAPSWAGNNVCYESIDELDKVRAFSSSENYCDVVFLLISQDIDKDMSITKICDYSKQIIKHYENKQFYAYSCVPAK